MPTVLFLDDDASFLRINQVYLQSRDYTVFTANCFEPAERLLREQAVDCIVLDVLMPAVNGWDACPDRVFIDRVWGKGFVFRAE